jgi:pimeloyl-ACP methyl ester carboxylesterase
MHNFSRRLQFTLLLTAWFSGLQAVADDRAGSPGANADDKHDVVEITLAATDGRIAWSDIIRALAETERFDASALDDLPDGSLDLNRGGARLAIFALDLALPPECRVAIVEGSADVEPQLRITLDRTAMRERTRDYKRRIRERAGDGADYGLTIDEDWPDASTGRPLVVLIHGYNAAADSLSVLHQRLRDDGWVCGLFSYPDDGPLDKSAALLAKELAEFRDEYPDRGVVIVAHSMGGLVARAVIEDPDRNPGIVRQLIMVATPNQGSMLAYFPGGLDWVQHLKDGHDHAGGLFARSAADGLNEAAPDLRPGSEFLKRLNARDRNPRVKYSLLLGTRGPLTEAELDEFRTLIARAIERSRLMQFVSPRIEPPLEDLDELVDGKGDGAVAVKRGRLDGVEDTQLLPFTHLTITRKADEPAAEELLDAILTRMSDDAGSN